MRKFEYEGSNRDGQPVSGYLEGDDRAQVEAQLLEQGIRVNTLSETGPAVRFFVPGATGLRAEEITMISEQLEMATRSGMPLAPAVKLLAADTRSRRVRRILNRVREMLEAGHCLADALNESNANMPAAVLSLIKVGEQTGNLPAILGMVAKHYSRMNEARGAIRQATVYPLFLVFCAVLLIGALYVFVVPQFQAIFQSFGAQLPLPTEFVLGMGRVMKELFTAETVNYWIAVLVVLLLLRLFLGVSKSAQYAYLRLGEWVRYNQPIYGPLYKAAVTERFARVLGLLLTNHAQGPESLILAGVSSGSLRLSEAARDAALLVSNGGRFSEALAAMREFRASFLWVLGNAEQQGNLGYTLLRLADAYEKEVERRTAAVITLATPVIIIVVGVVVAGFVLSMFMPIFQLSSIVGY